MAISLAVAGLWVAPLLMPLLGSEPRLALQPSPGLSLVLETERPLSAQSVGGAWAILAVAGWFGLACRTRQVVWWEPLLVVVTGALALVRLGNAWLLAIALVPAVARQLWLVGPSPATSGVLVTSLAAVTVLTLVSTRPPGLPNGALLAAQHARGGGAVLAAQPWASSVQTALGQQHVLGAGPLTAVPDAYWVDYARISDGQANWATLLDRHGVGVLVLDAAGEQRRAAALVRTAPDWQVVFDADGALVARRRE